MFSFKKLQSRTKRGQTDMTLDAILGCYALSGSQEARVSRIVINVISVIEAVV